MSERNPGDLLPSDRMQRQALEGAITQIHRGHQYAEEGDTFTIDGTTFDVITVRERTLGDLTDEDAQAEGMEDLEAYERLLERAHENFEGTTTARSCYIGSNDGENGRKARPSVEIAQRVFDPAQFGTGRVLADDVAGIVGDQTGADQRRTVVDRPDVGANV